HADGTGRLALIYVDEKGAAQRTSFDEMRALSSAFANVLKADGLARGDRVAVFLSQSLELPIAHLAAFRSGLVSVPLFTLFGEDALEFRLANSGARAVVTDEDGWQKLSKIRDRLPYLQDIYVTSDAVHAGAKSFSPSIPLLLSTPRERLEIRKARCTPTACCSGTCRTSRWCMISCPRRMT